MSDYVHGHKVHPDPNRPDDPTAGVIYLDILPKIRKPTNPIDANEWESDLDMWYALLELEMHFLRRDHNQLHDITTKWIDQHNGGKPR